MPNTKKQEIENGKFYPEVDSSPDFPKLEEKILKFWESHEIFQKSIDIRDSNPVMRGEDSRASPEPRSNADLGKSAGNKTKEFIFYDGPPFANGLPHYGHLLTGYVKDIFARYQTMKGKKVERRFGWDCHGLPAEMGVEKEIGIGGRKAIEEYGISKFNEHCKTSVMKYTKEWQYYVNRQARWVDFENDYKTMDLSYMESVMWAFKSLYDKGLVYEAFRVMPYSWAMETPVSNFETRMDNAYRERTDKAVTVAFELNEVPKFADKFKEQGYVFNKFKILAWTTTPWTLPSNLALGINPKIKYCGVIYDNTFHITAYNVTVAKYDKASIIELDEKSVSDLIGATYKPLFPYFDKHENSFRILSADFIEEGSGTGVVHLAPGFGEDDQKTCEKFGIELVCPVDEKGRYTSEIFDLPDLKLQGLNVVADKNKSADEPYKDEQIEKYGIVNLRIIAWLKAHGHLPVPPEDIKHNYPHCWRTDTPLIYRAISSWYVEVTKFKHRMVELNQQINWIPDHVKDGRFGKWLEGAHDWSISRNRFWGAPIPIWRSDDPNYPCEKAFGSIDELQKFFGAKPADLHRPNIDKLVAKNPNDPTGKSMLRRVTDVLDCWFESGSMPFAQVHYPFQNKDWFEKHFPADFIVEYEAQTRGWFYTLMVLGTALFDKPPFKNVICHGVVLDEKGDKLSKSKGNYTDPKELFTQYGADSLRWLMCSSSIMTGNELYIDKEGKFIRDVLRLHIKPIWNAYNFFTLYANSDGIKAELDKSSQNLMDRYILTKCRLAVQNVNRYMDAFDTPNSYREIENFFEVLNNWYIRRSRNRFWKTEKDRDKQEAYNTLYTVLNIMCRLAAPLIPLVTEEIYKGLTGNQSVHLRQFPKGVKLPHDEQLVVLMDKVRDVCNAALSIRNTQNIRVRQPLATLTVIGANAEQIKNFADIIKDEVNVKEIKFETDISKHASFNLKINFPVLGKRLPEKVKQIIPASKKGEWKKNADGTIEIAGETLKFEEASLLLEPKDKKAAGSVSTQDALVLLDLNLTAELLDEGLARDVVRLIQQARKDANLNVSDRIRLTIDASEKIVAAIKHNEDYIKDQTFAENLRTGNTENSTFVSEGVVEEAKVTIGITKA